MNDCQSCKQWIVRLRRLYSDGTTVAQFEMTDGNGHCQFLDKETGPDFGCNKYIAAPDFDHVITDVVEGMPWEHFKMGKCPECDGRGSGLEGGACSRCTGTGNVRYYDDGYIGEERTRMHPAEVQKSLSGGEHYVDPGTILKPLPKPSVFS